MKITLLQAALVWENPEANRKHFEKEIANLEETTDLIVLPEMFTTGFTMHPVQNAETMEGRTVTWMKSMAVQSHAALCGSLIIQEDNAYYNRMLFVTPDGSVEYYDKRHLFTLAGEETVYTAGEDKKIVVYKGWKICLLICYDLRFPAFARNLEDYDLLLYVANWPEKRIQAWNILLQARAIENMCYVAGVNRVGEDGNGHTYNGQSQVFDYMGNPLTEHKDVAAALTVAIAQKPMYEARDHFGFLNDRDRITIS